MVAIIVDEPNRIGVSIDELHTEIRARANRFMLPMSIDFVLRDGRLKIWSRTNSVNDMKSMKFLLNDFGFEFRMEN